eukprot:gene42438-2645_t
MALSLYVRIPGRCGGDALVAVDVPSSATVGELAAAAATAAGAPPGS